MPSSYTPSNSAGKEHGKTIIVRAHAKLAARVAFGDMQGHAAWQATWPTLHDFQASLPLLWPEPTRELYCHPCARQPTVKVPGNLNGSSSCVHVEKSFAVLPPPATGLWATVAPAPRTIGSEMKSTTRETDGKPL